jgi:protein-S-isoprenylcysteine O-methyltransferase Ste14
MMAAIIYFLYLNFLVIPKEEEGLTEYFGDSYAKYLDTVPRWLSPRVLFSRGGKGE